MVHEIVHHRDWHKFLDKAGPTERAIIRRYLDRLSRSGLDLGYPYIRRVDRGLFELRVPTGHRLYFVIAGQDIQMLSYGNKSSQKVDIARAMERRRSLNG